MSEPVRTREPVLVCQVGDLPTGAGAVVADVDGRWVTIARDSAGDLHAFDDTCTHEGEIEGDRIECWLHGSQFDMRTGEPKQLPATRPVAVHTVIVDGGDVFVALSD